MSSKSALRGCEIQLRQTHNSTGILRRLSDVESEWMKWGKEILQHDYTAGRKSSKISTTRGRGWKIINICCCAWLILHRNALFLHSTSTSHEMNTFVPYFYLSWVLMSEKGDQKINLLTLRWMMPFLAFVTTKKLLWKVLPVINLIKFNWSWKINGESSCHELIYLFHTIRQQRTVDISIKRTRNAHPACHHLACIMNTFN